MGTSKCEAHEGENQAQFEEADRQDTAAVCRAARPIGRTGVTKSCSSVPRSFSRTIEKAVRNVVTLSSRMAVSPGRKKFGERESGLNSSFGRISTANVSLLTSTRRSDSSRPIAVVTLMAWPATDESEPSISTSTCALMLMQQSVGVVDGNLDANARLAGDDHVVHVVVAADVAHHAKGVGIFQAVEQFAAFAAAVGVENHGVDLADVGVDAVAEQQHLQQRNNQGEKQRAEIATHVQRLFVKDRAESAENVTHGWPRFAALA